MRTHGIQSLLDTIVEDATVYFLIIFTGHLLVIFFEFFAPVSENLANFAFPCSLQVALRKRFNSFPRGKSPS